MEDEIGEKVQTPNGEILPEKTKLATVCGDFPGTINGSQWMTPYLHSQRISNTMSY